MDHHDVVENDVKKELSVSLIGILAFLGLVLLIGISAFLRPAGQHFDAKALNAQASAPASSPTGISSATATDPNATVSKPDDASMTTGGAPKTVVDPSTVDARNASTAEAKSEIASKTGETPAIAPPVASVTATDSTKVEKSENKAGEALYASSCKTCHEAGIAGAPKIGDKANWTPRIAQGKDTLYKHAIEGFQGKAGVMPPKGGSTASNDEVKSAVDYMVSKSS